MPIIPDRAQSAAAARSQADYGAFFLAEHFSDLVVIVKEESANEEENAEDSEGPPSKRQRVSSDSAGHVRCALVTTVCQGTGIKLVLSTSPCARTKQHITRLPGHKMVLWGRSGFFRSKVRSMDPVTRSISSTGTRVRFGVGVQVGPGSFAYAYLQYMACPAYAA
jgi:hypothetical protein